MKTMKIAVCSDLHLEFGDLDLQNTENADVLVLSGDILVAQYLTDTKFGFLTQTMVGERFHAFIERCCERFPDVVYVMGNHEHYHGDFATSAKIIRETFADLENFNFLDKEWTIINGVKFFGGTLWTNMNNKDHITKYEIKKMMNDFRIVKNTLVGENCKFSPDDAIEEHYDFRRKLDEFLLIQPDMPVVVVGHHAPSKKSTHPRYARDVLMNGGYSSDLDSYIMERPQIKLWTHGHTHEPFDYMIGETRIVCNPRGYIGHEQRADDFELKYYEV